MKRIFVSSLVIALAGCSPPKDLLEKQEILRADVSRLEQRLAEQASQTAHPNDVTEAETRLSGEIDVLRTAIDQNAIVQRSAVADMRAQLQSMDRRLAGMDARLAAAIPPQTNVPPTPPSSGGVSVYTPPPPPAVKKKEPAEDPFPVRVFDIAGRQIVTGSHKSTRYVETDETYRDEYGTITRRTMPVEEDVNEYGFVAAFSAENLTAEPREIAASAGTVTRTFLLNPGTILTNGAVTSSPGSKLRITTGGITKTFPVTY